MKRFVLVMGFAAFTAYVGGEMADSAMEALNTHNEATKALHDEVFKGKNLPAKNQL